jgi:hypothetical protein
MDRTEIIREIQSLAKRDGKAPGRLRFEAATGLGEHDWRGKYWARWNDAIAEAGLSPNEKQEAIPEPELLEAYLGLTIQLQRVPTESELRLHARATKGFPATRTFLKRLGRKSVMLEKLLSHALTRGVTPSIEAAIRSAIPHDADAPEDATPAQRIVGYVYLLKSGRRYKIGKAVAPDRRRHEIGLQLPEKVEPVHSIETDDPSGIEFYWHKRFRAKRLNGEWFDLSRDDVRAFKRRKFM